MTAWGLETQMGRLPSALDHASTFGRTTIPSYRSLLCHDVDFGIEFIFGYDEIGSWYQTSI